MTTPDGYKVLHADRSVEPPRIRSTGAVDEQRARFEPDRGTFLTPTSRGWRNSGKGSRQVGLLSASLKVGSKIVATVYFGLVALLFVWAVWLLATDDPDGGRHPAGTVMLVVAVLLGVLGFVSLRSSRS